MSAGQTAVLRGHLVVSGFLGGWAWWLLGVPRWAEWALAKGMEPSDLEGWRKRRG